MSIDEVYTLEPDCPECGEAQDEPPGDGSMVRS